MSAEDIFSLSEMTERPLFRAGNICRLSGVDYDDYKIEIGSVSGNPVDVDAEDLSNLFHKRGANHDYGLSFKFVGPVVLHGDASNLFNPGGQVRSFTVDESISNLDTSNVTNMQGMFSHCILHPDCSFLGFDTSNVTDMSEMFRYAYGVKHLDLSSFDTSKVVNMRGMFADYASLESVDLSSFDTSNVTIMACMFDGCEGLKSVDLSSFDMSNTCVRCRMFAGCKNLESIDVSSFKSSDFVDSADIFVDSGLTRLENVALGTKADTVILGSIEGDTKTLEDVFCGKTSCDNVKISWPDNGYYSAGSIDSVPAYKVNALMEKARIIQDSQFVGKDVSELKVSSQVDALSKECQDGLDK